MMWTRADLKSRGKIALKANYWRCVGAGLLLTICTGGTAASAGRSSCEHMQEFQNTMEADPEQAAILVIAILLAVGFVIFLSSFMKILLLNPLMVGCRHFFRRNLEVPQAMGEVTWGFRNFYGRNLVTLFLTGLFELLWGILFIIPGVIKAYSYRLVPYILEDEPDLGPTEVISLSRRMMDGQKMNAFMLDLSFIGWYLLAGLTAGLVNVFYSGPYKAGTDAAFYEAVKSEYYSRSY
ncbi:MAG: DUF975 family protein [Lachnospiraceae bacterium]|nr:DUF975 family protein [Lachnospiraceae bacterium]